MNFPFDRRVKHLRVLLAIRTRGALRFNQVQDVADLSPTEVIRILADLQKEFLVHARPYGKKARKLLLEYELSKKGEAYLSAMDAFRTTLEENRKVVGEEPLRRLDQLYA